MDADRRWSDSYDPRTWGLLDPLPPPRAAAIRRSFAMPIAWAVSAAVLAAATAIALNVPAVPLHPPAEVAIASRPPPVRPVEELAQRRTLTLSQVSDLDDALTTAGIATDQVPLITTAAHQAIGGAPGEIRVLMEMLRQGSAGRLVRLSLSRDDGSGGVVTATPAGYTGAPVAAQLSVKAYAVRGEVDASSFYSSAVTAGVPDSLIPAFAAAFAFDFDFQREVKPGDTFEAVFERTLDGGGNEVGVPRLVFVSLRTAAKSRNLYMFKPPGEDAGWFDGRGGSTVRSLMRTPVDGARISSQFGPRLHPILGFVKMHNGTDFAAPVGTKIFAAGDAVIEFIGPKGPNGNFIKLRHTNGWETLYLHMNRFAPGLSVGSHVVQGQQIGEIGTTGRSTGPHLHYEVHIDGVPVNPMEIETGTARTLDRAALKAFLAERDRIDVSRAAQAL